MRTAQRVCVLGEAVCSEATAAAQQREELVYLVQEDLVVPVLHHFVWVSPVALRN